MTMVRIDVTKKDIEQGCQLIANNCPVAKAIQRRTSCPASVCNEYALLGSDIDRVNEGYKINLPPFVGTFIYNFDWSSNPSVPFSFYLDIDWKKVKNVR